MSDGHERQSLQEFFETQLKAFQAGALEDFAATVALPMHVKAGSRQMYLANTAAFVEAMASYRNNLLVECYTTSFVSILKETPLDDDTIRAVVRWVHKNNRGAVIRVNNGTYLCKRYPDGLWRVTESELMQDPQRHLTLGMPFGPAPAADVTEAEKERTRARLQKANR